MAPHGVVSADSHMTEPADLWKERLDKRYRDHGSGIDAPGRNLTFSVRHRW